jgi:phage terminase large subunit-like protein
MTMNKTSLEELPLLKPEELTRLKPAELAVYEKISREQARRKLNRFCAYVSPWYDPTLPHVKLICSELEQVKLFIKTKGQQGTGRLILEVPPQHTKTETTSRHFPPFVLGDLPETRILLTSYNAELASDNSLKARDIVQSDAYNALFGEKGQYKIEDIVELSDEKRSINNWEIAGHRGSVKAAGVGGGLTGKAGDLIIIDDPHKDREETLVESNLKRVVNWYNSVIVPRITAHTAVIIIHTRWDPNDLIGTLLKLMAEKDDKVDQWRVICLPALALEPDLYVKTRQEQIEKMAQGIWLDFADPLGRKPGEALWEELHPAKHILRARENDEFEYWSLWQQQPRPLIGGFFEHKDFPIIELDQVPQKLQWYRYVDLAISESNTADYNSSVAMALDPSTGVIYLRDMLRERGWLNFRKTLVGAMLSDLETGTIWGFEDVSFQLLAFLEMIRDPRLANVSMLSIKPEGDKGSRAQPLRFRAKGGRVKLVRGPWNQKYIDEAVLFTGRGQKRDDQIDTSSGGLRMISDDRITTSLKTVSSAPVVVNADEIFG